LQAAGDRGCLSAPIALQSEDSGIHRRGDAGHLNQYIASILSSNSSSIGYLNQHRINLVFVVHS
jgi:hypothetical protein